MKYSVNGIKTFRGMEGHGFNANLLADGKKVCFIMDEGNGGCYSYEWADNKEPKVNGQHRQISGVMMDYPMTPAEKAFNDYINAMPAYDNPWHKGEKSYHTDDCVIGKFVDEAEGEKFLKGKCKKLTLFTLKGDKVGEFRTINADYKMHKMVIRQKLDAKYGRDYEIINERFN